MAKIKTKEKHDDPKLRDDIASFKASLAFIFFCLVIFLTVTCIENKAPNYAFRNYLDNNIWLLIIPFGIFAISAIFKIITIKNKTDESYRYFSTSDFLGLASIFVLYTLTYAATTSIFMYNMVIVGFAVGYYVKRFFGTDFYAVTLMNLSLAFALWLKFGVKGWGTALTNAATLVLFAGAAITVILVVLFAIGRLISGKGSANILDKALYVFGVKDSKSSAKLCFVPVFISLILGGVLGGILMFAPNYLTLLVAEIIILIQYIALGVYYTVKLLNQ